MFFKGERSLVRKILFKNFYVIDILFLYDFIFMLFWWFFGCMIYGFFFLMVLMEGYVSNKNIIKKYMKFLKYKVVRIFLNNGSLIFMVRI